jgi:hypothetical protein
MARKKKIKREQILIIVAVLAVIMVVASGGITITGAVAGVSIIPDKQCYKAAENKDNAAKNVATYLSYSGEGKSHCNVTGETLSYDSYRDPHMGGFHRTVFENGDVRGHIMNTNYILCSDGRAKVELLGTYYARGMKWGIIYFKNNPILNAEFKIEKCNTI